MGISILRASISEDFSFRASLFCVLSDVSTGPSFILKWVCICLRAIDIAADPQKMVGMIEIEKSSHHGTAHMWKHQRI